MTSRPLPVAALIVLAACVVPASQASAIEGRLFFSPAERALLDEGRRNPARLPAPEPVADAGKVAPPPPPPPPLTVNGVVRRSDGVTTVWLNDRPVTGTRAPDGTQVAPVAPGRVSVRPAQGKRAVEVGVGQQFDVASGEVRDRYATLPAQADAPATEPKPAPRRPSRDRELLRDLMRELDASESRGRDGSAGNAPAPAPAN